MVKMGFIAFIVFLLFIVLIIPVDAQDVITPGEEIDAELLKFADVVGELELASLRDFGRYTQILAVTPDTKAGRLPCPVDDLVCPVVEITLSHITATVNVYQTPGGKHGYEIVAEYVDLRGQHWRRVINQGPETLRERGWYVYSPDIAVKL